MVMLPISCATRRYFRLFCQYMDIYFNFSFMIIIFFLAHCLNMSVNEYFCEVCADFFFAFFFLYVLFISFSSKLLLYFVYLWIFLLTLSSERMSSELALTRLLFTYFALEWTETKFIYQAILIVCPMSVRLNGRMTMWLAINENTIERKITWNWMMMVSIQKKRSTMSGRAMRTAALRKWSVCVCENQFSISLAKFTQYQKEEHTVWRNLTYFPQ